MNEPLESLRPAPMRPPVTDRPRSPRLAWAITLGESALLAGGAFPLFKYWLMLPVPIRFSGATVLAALALVVIFRMVRFHLRRSRRRSNPRCTITRQPEIEPEPASALASSNSAKAVPAELPCKDRFRNPAVLTPSGSSTGP